MGGSWQVRAACMLPRLGVGSDITCLCLCSCLGYPPVTSVRSTGVAGAAKIVFLSSCLRGQVLQQSMPWGGSCVLHLCCTCDVVVFVRWASWCISSWRKCSVRGGALFGAYWAHAGRAAAGGRVGGRGVPHCGPVAAVASRQSARVVVDGPVSIQSSGWCWAA